MSHWKKLKQAKRIVIKLGTQVVIDETGAWAQARITALVAQCCRLLESGHEVLLVSSGAVGLGRHVLNLDRKTPLNLAQKQACAAIGQNLMMTRYQEAFARHQRPIAQLLLTAYDFSDRQRYLNLRKTLETLLEFKAVPVINENDTVSTVELKETQSHSFGDNDKLSAIVAGKLGADVLVMLTNVEGLYTDNPTVNPDARRIEVVEGFESLGNIQLTGQSDHGRGGMASKVQAARIAAISGVHVVIASGYQDNILDTLFSGNTIPGTLIMAQTPLRGKKRWLGLASGYNGIVVVNPGARTALVQRGASLLPSGIIGVQGDFPPRQVVSIQDESGLELGRGLTNFSADAIRQIQGRHSQEIATVLGVGEPGEVIHRDNLVIFEEMDEWNNQP